MGKPELTQLAARMNKRFGKVVVTTADMVPDVYHLRRPSGIMQLDIDTAGGLPAGTVNYLSGPDGAGKTDLLYRYMAQQQRYYGQDCVLALAAIEHPLDHFRLRRLGVMVPVPKERIEMEQADRKFRGVAQLTKDEIKELQTGIGTFWPVKCDTMEDTMDAVLNLIEDGHFHMIGVDSLTAMLPKAMAEKDLDEETKRGAHATCVTRFFAKYYPLTTRLDGNPIMTTVVFTQQVRANDKKSTAPSYIAKFLPDYATSGAYAGRHGKCFDICISNGGRKKESGDDGDRKQVVSKNLLWEITKGKAGSHEGIFGEVEFSFKTKENIDYPATVFVAGIRYGVLQERNGLITWLHNGVADKRIEKLPLKTFASLLLDDVSVDYAIRRDILAAANISCRYK